MAKTSQTTHDVNTEIDNLGKKLKDHGDQISSIQSITTLGFIIALITLAGVVIASVAFVMTQIQQTNQQTRLLQEIKDKVSK